MPRALLVVLLAVIAIGGGLAAQQTAPANLGFESGAPGEAPPGWQLAVAQPQPGVAARIVTEARNGAQGVLLSRDATAAPTASLNLLQLIDATPYRGRRVRFRMAAKVDTPGSPAQMWMRVDGPPPPGAPPPTLFLDTMDDRPIVSKEWSYYEIVADVPQEAARILFGVYLVGAGNAWVDDATLESLPRPDVPKPEAPKAITRRGLVNLMAFARLLGYVRHFHPSDEAAATDWDAFAIAGVRAVESSTDGDALTRRLADLFRPIAPAVVIVPSGSARTAARDADSGEQKQRTWRHVGFGLSTTQNVYRSERVVVSQPVPEFTAELGGGVSVRMPLSVPTDDSGTLPRGTMGGASATPHLTRGRFTMTDRATRLGTLLLAWNVLQHSYPYFDVVKTPWSVALSTALQEAATQKDDREFGATLRRMIAALHDGQARVIAGDPDLPFTPPLALDWIEGAITVVSADAATGALPGDLVLSVDGTPAASMLEAALPLVSSATPQWASARAVQELLQGPKGTTLKLRLERAADPSQRVEVTVTRSVASYPGPRRAEVIGELESGVMYVDLGRVTESDFIAALPALAAAKGIVFDLRTPPAYLRPEPLFSHLAETPVTSPQFLLPVIPAPDREQTTFMHNGEWNIAPAAPFLAAKKVFLTDAHAIGYAESCLEIVRALKLGEIVGSPTAGTNGTVNRFQLPGDYTVLFTGTKVLMHDGSQYHGIGITPSVAAAPTRAGVAAGRDEVLERAVQVLTAAP